MATFPEPTKEGEYRNGFEMGSIARISEYLRALRSLVI